MSESTTTVTKFDSGAGHGCNGDDRRRCWTVSWQQQGMHHYLIMPAAVKENNFSIGTNLTNSAG
ncbi:hypothetical protein TSUD_136280 [Trifolium subterraneum]|uniref:Uncharacterized protein n=1 Tax=Trifolium subterraneum TaxID=3900 RepID=A0A2Z6NKV5_TRISU|nr:hypothetical protein TSUD_136280 [Trifolium subterraneum]